MSHTPGPWKICEHDNIPCSCGILWSIPGDFPVFTAHDCKIGDVHQHMADAPDMIYRSISLEERNANAKLIAAAPELLEACLRVVEVIKENTSLYNELQSAIQKATI